MKVVCIVLLVILLLLVLILLLPAGGRLEYSEDGLIFSLRAGPIYYRFYPKKEKKTPPEELKPVTYPVNQTGDAAKPPPSPSTAQPEQPSGANRSPQAQPEQSAGADTPPQAQPEQPAGADTPPQAQPEQPSGADKPPQAQPEQSAGADKPPQAQPEQSAGADKPPQAQPERKTSKKKPKKRRKKPAKSPTAEDSGGKTGGKLELAMELAPELLDLAGALVRWMRVDELTLDYTIAGRWDAAGAAIQYGTVYATGGVLYPLLEQRLTIKRFHIGAEIDFQEEIPRVYVLLNLSWRVWALLVLLYRAFKLYMRLKKDE